MKSQLLIFFVFAFSIMAIGQNTILYDLDSYKRVDIDYRYSTFSPDFLLEYANTLNTPGQEKNYGLQLGGLYYDYQIINNEKNQKTYNTIVDFGARAGTLKSISLWYSYDYDNRAYSGSTYFKNGFSVNSNTGYSKNFNSLKQFDQRLSLTYNIGFGFGRLEVINNAWHGARILEELENNGLLSKVPEASEMKELFDVIGDLEFDRIMDNRLMTMNRLEKMIKYIEDEGWIDKGSIPAFVTIYDAFRYERFFTRLSGERLEFSLSPRVDGRYSWVGPNIESLNSNLEAGFEGVVEYQIHRNGDLEYYTTKSFTGKIGYYQDYREGQDEVENIISADVVFNYVYRYLPSLRTNLELSTLVTGSILQAEEFTSKLDVQASVAYKYYFSPATQLVMRGLLRYNDPEFQIDEYQPFINARFSMDIVHAIR